ncbi:hypothetical protein AUEXF2481DRAFT_28756 [Aureobasidium subglaciale EXF-2481]|uniref:Formin GTPase-binding domain-containing protein n=1 Tax=Aureobasidium subglaciale (strain EXF-2481) TaxID=1043005 RepID=A0A074YIY5_AURSE|nr:uncharacterized protein AUEXF2481DRAFT_28756 [Aureobasidium subglaciale EXF-2481]KEQ96044.1 hypothetical protein AUEXF2481DRAFT_28756 [Aureobasidium subglaciale EXF-2481]
MLKSILPKEHRRSKSKDLGRVTSNTTTQMVPLLPPDHPHSATQPTEDSRSSRQAKKENAPPHKRSKSSVSLRSLGRDKDKDKERKSRKEREKEKQSQRGANDQDCRDGRTRMKKTKSSTSLRGLLGKMNRSSKDLSDTVHDKENLSPPTSALEPSASPSWPQHPPIMQQPPSVDAEIDRYTPKDYSPSKQRDFSAYGQPVLSRPLSSGRPKSLVIPGSMSFLDALNRPISRERDRTQLGSRGSDHSQGSRGSLEGAKQSFDRKVSSSSNERPAPKPLANVPKRGPRVMAAVAAFDEKARENGATLEEQKLDARTVDTAFEAVLDSRNIPENMRQKMRTLTLRVKADFVKQDKGAVSPTKPETRLPFFHDEPTQQQTADREEEPVKEDLSKRSRSRSKTFTLTRSDGSPRKQKPDSRPNSIHIPRSSGTLPKNFVPPSPGRGPQAACPDEFVAYLENVRDPVQMEVGRLHKLRLLLRNETVAWVDNFISLGGMAQVVDLLHRIMQIEWREEHEDQLLHEALLCLKGLCTTEVALKNLASLADALFPKLLAMLFDEEKKGPSEFTTRGIIINILFAYLGAARTGGPHFLAQRARVILAYLADPQKPEEAQPVSFVLSMRQSRPYKVWYTEVSNVTKEVFWIFLHHLNVIPLPEKDAPDGEGSTQTQVDGTITPGQSYAERFFPGDRPPVPAAPYIGGVEWDATTYMTAHLDLVNGLIASILTREDRNQLRSELKASGWEKMMGGTMRTCKEKFYCGVHSGLQNWIAAAQADGWDITYVRYGPSKEEMAASSPKKSSKKGDSPPQIGLPIIQMPKLTLGLDRSNSTPAFNASNDNDGWLL